MLRNLLLTFLGLFFRIPPQLRGAGATGAIFAAAAAAFANGQHEVAGALAVVWAVGLLVELYALPAIRHALRDENHDGTPDALAKIRLPDGVTWVDVRLLLGHVQRTGLERALDAVMRLPSRQPPALKSTTTGLLVLLALAPAHSGCAAASALCAGGIDVEQFGAAYAGTPEEPLELAQTTVDLDVCGLPVTIESFATSADLTVCVVAPLLGRQCDSKPIGGAQ